MRQRWVLSLVAAAALAATVGIAVLAGGFREKRVTIAVLNHGKVAELALDGFKAGMAELGFPEGRRVTYLYSGPLQGEALEAEARRLAGTRPDLILALSTPSAKAGKEAAKASGIPLVFAPASDPVNSGLAASLAKPGRNATGVTFGVQEPVRLQWLKSIAPKIQTVLIPYNPDDISPRLSVERLKPVAEDLGLRLELRHVRSVADLNDLLAALPEGVDALFIPTDALVASQLDSILAATARKGIPVSAVDRRSVQKGALMSYGIDLEALGRQGSRLAAQVLVGTPAGDLPIETAELALSVNVDAARRLGIKPPDSALRQAEVFRTTEAANAR